MWTNLTALSLPPANLIVRGVLVYFAVLLNEADGTLSVTRRADSPPAP